MKKRCYWYIAKVKNYNLNVTEVRDSDFQNAFPGIFNFTVGILASTFLCWTEKRRHGCLQRLVQSIRKYHPNISIIIADDSPGNDFEKGQRRDFYKRQAWPDFRPPYHANRDLLLKSKFKAVCVRRGLSIGFSKPIKASMMNESKIVNELEKDKNIRYFRMPENNGWNSGRALLISQVQTEYFVSCDDDFYFLGKFNLEIMLGVRDPRSKLYFNQSTRMKWFVDPC